MKQMIIFKNGIIIYKSLAHIYSNKCIKKRNKENNEPIHLNGPIYITHIHTNIFYSKKEKEKCLVVVVATKKHNPKKKESYVNISI